MRALLLLLVACSGSPPSVDQCPDPACRQDLIVARFGEDPEAAGALLGQLAEPTEQLAVLMALVEGYPGQTDHLCAQLPKGASRVRCSTINQRPHLWAEPDAPDHPSGRSGPGPGSRDMLPAQTKSLLVDIEAAATTCPDDGARKACVGRRARQAAMSGKARRAAAMCSSIEGEDKWRQECHFNAAEGAISQRGDRGYPQAVELCLLSGPFASNCLSHLLMILGRHTPDALSAGASEWSRSITHAAAIGNFWEKRAPAFAPIAVDRQWSEATASSFAQLSTVSGRALAFLPPEALPHVRAAAALRLVQLEAAEVRSLEGWQARLRERLADQEPVANGIGGVPPMDFIADRWPEDLAGEDTRPAIFYLRTSRRTTVEDPDLDELICLLEALERVKPPGWKTHLQEATSHPEEAVAWTATRLLEGRTDDAEHRPELMVQPVSHQPSSGAPVPDFPEGRDRPD